MGKSGGRGVRRWRMGGESKEGRQKVKVKSARGKEVRRVIEE